MTSYQAQTLALVALLLCASPNAQAIIGGREIRDPNHPAMRSTVGLLVNVPNYQDVPTLEINCSGVILSHEIVLTAAHCINDSLAGISFTNLLGDAIVRPVSEALRHPLYVEPTPGIRPNEQTVGYDVGLVRFSGGLPRGFDPARLAPDNGSFVEGRNFTISGFGMRSVGSALEFQSQFPIAATFQLKFREPHFVIAASAPALRSSVCGGDSGGPWFLRSGGQMYVTGITSAGSQEEGPRGFTEWFHGVERLCPNPAGAITVGPNLYHTEIRFFILLNTGITY